MQNFYIYILIMAKSIAKVLWCFTTLVVFHHPYPHEGPVLSHIVSCDHTNVHPFAHSNRGNLQGPPHFPPLVQAPLLLVTPCYVLSPSRAPSRTCASTPLLFCRV